MNLKLDGKKVLITGSSKGLGLSLVKAFMEEEAIVTMCSRSTDSLEKAFLSINTGYKNKLKTCIVDATNEDSIKQCVKFAVEQMSGIDVLINNVGGANKFASFFDLGSTDWIETFQHNVMSIVHFCREAHSFIKQSQSPRIINISSQTGLQPGIFNPHYSACKAGVINLSKHLSNIFVKDNILVNCVVPGPFESDSWDRYIQRVADQKNITFEVAKELEFKIANQSIPLNRIGKVEDITPIILLLSSSLSSWTTGSCIVVDGGKIRGIH